MKLHIGFVLPVLAILMLLCLSGAAAAADIDVDFTVHAAPGETVAPEYPDFSYLIGKNLTKDDFNITYWVTEKTNDENYIFDAEGRLTLSEKVSVSSGNSYTMMWIRYTPKVQGVGKETTFRCKLRIHSPLKSVVLDRTEAVMTTEYGSVFICATASYGCYSDWIASISYDSSVADVSIEDDIPDWNKYIFIRPKGEGETEVVITAYNGLQVRIPVVVHAVPTKVSFAKSSFTARLGEVVDLGLDLGNGSLEPMPTIKVKVDDLIYSGSSDYGDRYYFPTDASHFSACTVGHHEITVTTLNGLTGTVYVSVVSNDFCAGIKTDAQTIYARVPVTIITCDADGKEITVPVSITKGADIARLDGNYLIASAAGTVELTATNPDGTTVSQTFEVVVTPNEMTLPANDVTLEIGERFTVEVIFDQGSMPHTLTLVEQDATEQYLYTTRQEGLCIIAQAPGKATYTVKAGDLTQTLNITVPDSDKAVSIVVPQQPFPMGQSCQLYVMDKTGKVYPAKFSTQTPDYYGTITEDGFFRARLDGYFDVGAQLADGRWLSAMIEVKKIPKWLQTGAVVITKGEIEVLTVLSDVGIMENLDLTFEVADERIAAIDGGVLEAKKNGTTVVTVTSVASGASTTFTVEVVSDMSVYLGMSSLSVPFGGVRYLPVVTDTSTGESSEIKWTVTHETPGEGNPEDSGFIIEDGMIGCIWPGATCELTGTIRNKSTNYKEYKVKVSVCGYKLPDEIMIEPDVIWLKVGSTKQVHLVFDEPGCMIEDVLWYADTEGVVSYEELSAGDLANITGLAPGTAQFIAMLENGAYAFCSLQYTILIQPFPATSMGTARPIFRMRCSSCSTMRAGM